MFNEYRSIPKFNIILQNKIKETQVKNVDLN